MKTYTMRVEMKKLAYHNKTKVSSKIIEIQVSKRIMMRMRKEPLLNLCELNLGPKSLKFQSPSKSRKMVQSLNAPDAEELNRVTKLRLVSIIKADIPQMKLMKIIKGIQKAQKIKEAVNKMNLLLLLKAFTKTIGN